MPTKPIDRLMFSQGGLCFFCKNPLSKSDASVEHLVASANGGANSDDNCVACCKALNTLLGNMSLKEKVQVVLNQKGQFKCPNGSPKATAPAKSAAPTIPVPPQAPKSVVTYSPEQVAQTIANLVQRGASRPRTVKTLTSTVRSIFGMKLPPDEIDSLLMHLRGRGIIKYEGTKVSYEFPVSGT